MPRPVKLRDEPRVDDAVEIIRGAPIDEASLRLDCGRMAKRFRMGGAPLFGFSVEAVSLEWPLDRILREGRVRARARYAVCTVSELRRLGCELLATFGDDPPHFTVRLPNMERVPEGVTLLGMRVQPNPAWRGV